MPPTLLQQMQQLDALQQRTQKYYSLFFSIQQQQQRNEFLDASDAGSQEHCLFPQTQEYKTYVAPQQAQERQQQQQDIYQSQVITTRDINISHIFEDIVLRDNPSRKQQPIGVQLMMQNGQTSEIDLESHHNDDFSLSNFSSFNVNRENQQTLEFRHLLQCIQKTIGKTLSRTGIERIIAQIVNQVNEMDKEKLRYSEKTAVNDLNHSSCGQNSLLDISQVNHKFDTALNNKVFNRKSTDRQRVLQYSKDISLLSPNITIHQQKISPHYKYKSKHKNKSNLVEDKENGPKINLKQIPQKQLRIIRKNNPKQLLMLYSDIRQVDQFCITNKIYGRERQKVVKAVQANKISLTLQ